MMHQENSASNAAASGFDSGPTHIASPTHTRARDLGVAFDGTTGPYNAITDVPGVRVGYSTIISDAAQMHGAQAACTGVTAILPRGDDVESPCAAGTFALNGNGEMTGRTWIEESGSLTTPVAITNTHSVGIVHSAIDQWLFKRCPRKVAAWMLPVVAETWDGYLNAINSQHVTPQHVLDALDSAASGPIAEGNVGGGTGMCCYGFKGGSGTASRTVTLLDKTYTVGVFLQCNFGKRYELNVHGVLLGRDSKAPNPMQETRWFEEESVVPNPPEGSGSVIAVVATDAPLLPVQCKALARRVPMGLARTGTTGGHFSGDIFLAFSTGNPGSLRSSMAAEEEGRALDSMEFVAWGLMDALYEAVAQCVEESVVNTLVAARDIVGRDGHASYALPHDEVRRAFGR
jgi:L-aminopeptidase/D-esterase-like protein